MPQAPHLLCLCFLQIYLLVESHPGCLPLADYEAPYISNYKRLRHMGHFYELAFRDLYPAPPHSDCHHTVKYLVNDYTYNEKFMFDVIYFDDWESTTTDIVMKQSTPDSQVIVDQFMENMTYANHNIPACSSTTFHTTLIAFGEALTDHDDDDINEQYEWLVEFTCGSDNSTTLPILFPGDFVGINLYSKSEPHTPQAEKNLQDMLSAIEEQGLGWAIDPKPWFGFDSGFNLVPHSSKCAYDLEP